MYAMIIPVWEWGIGIILIIVYCQVHMVLVMVTRLERFNHTKSQVRIHSKYI